LYNSEIFRPEVTVIFRASSLPGKTVRLARESSGNNVNWFEVVFSAFSDISESLNIWQASVQHALAVIIDLDLPHALHSCALKAQVDTANSGK